jgi:hypothetical protein
MNQPESFCSAINTWTQRRLNSRASYYSGRGVKRGDLNEDHLEMIHKGIKRDFSPQHAAVFVEFVHSLTDLSATAFLNAFEVFYAGGCADAKCYTQTSRDSIAINAQTDEGKFAEGMATIAAVLGGGSRNPEMDSLESDSIKWAFLSRHGKRPKKGTFLHYSSCNNYW